MSDNDNRKEVDGRKRSIMALSLVHASLNEITEDRDRWRTQAQRLTVITAVCAVLIVGLVVALVMRPREYFATTPTGQIIPLVPLNKPTITSVAVQRFAVTTITESFSLNFRQWRTQLSRVEPSFTSSGYKSFLEQLERTGWIKTIEDSYFTASATEISRPVLVSEGVGPNGVYGYVVEVPMTLTLENQNERRRQEIRARIVVVRVPTSEKVEGIAVDKVFVS